MNSKRVLDLALTFVLGCFALPIALLIALIVALDCGLPILYRAERVGRDGKPFKMLKFRTMHSGPGGESKNSPDGGGPKVTLHHDRRITRSGRLLRSIHIDELPQLWNVWVGEMSLVGPRPEDPRFVDLEDPRWQRVLSVPPGITGPTQLAYGAEEAEKLGVVDPERVYVEELLPKKLASDERYVLEHSPMGDLNCLWKTLWSLRGSRTSR